MTFPTWPADLPQKLITDGYSYSFADGRLKTAMDAGPPKMRRRFSAAVKAVAGQFYGGVDDVVRLERFWNEETAGGTLPFLIPDQNLDGIGLQTEAGVQILDQSGQSLLNTGTWLVMFGDTPPSGQVVSGTIYKATLSLTILP
ncbi:hypothetical protein CTI14_00275 [Methylobacterium radiotolerans]|nr:hypothetical protein CTI14_00275 [Methylobacterium radiotolerans]